MDEDYGRCLENVKTFVDKYQKDAQALADMLGSGVTATEVLALSGNETSYGTSPFVKFGNFFGLHGHGPAGTYYTTGNMSPKQSLGRYRSTEGLRTGFIFGLLSCAFSDLLTLPSRFTARPSLIASFTAAML